MTTHELTRQPEHVIEDADRAYEAAKHERDIVMDRRDTAAYLLASAVAGGMQPQDMPESWIEDFRTAEAAVEEARATTHTARVVWYHARGRHAHSNLALCCEPETDR